MNRLIVLLVSCLALSCAPIHERGARPYPDKSHYKAEELGFNTVKNRVLRPSCIGCHGDGGGVNLESYEKVRANLEGIRKTALLNQSMPKRPVPPLSSYQMGLLNAWLEAGAPLSAPEDEPSPPPLLPTYESIRANVLVPKCLICHSPGKAVARVPLVTIDDLLDSPLEIVIPGKPDESGLVISITRDDDKIMPPLKGTDGKPSGAVRLSSEEIAAIKEWITKGAVE